MSGVATAIVGSAVIGGVMSKQTSDAQARAAREGQDVQYRIFKEQQEAQEPFRQAGITTQNELLRRFGLGGEAGTPGYGELMKNFSMADYQADPGYQFRLQEGLKQLQGKAAARGGALSGATLKGVQGYAQGLASQEYGNAYQRYADQLRNRYNMLSGQQAVGQQATNEMGAAGRNYANQASELATQAGNARASGYIGIGNALTSALGTGLKYYQNQQLLDKIK